MVVLSFLPLIVDDVLFSQLIRCRSATTTRMNTTTGIVRDNILQGVCAIRVRKRGRSTDVWISWIVTFCKDKDRNCTIDYQSV